MLGIEHPHVEIAGGGQYGGLRLEYQELAGAVVEAGRPDDPVALDAALVEEAGDHDPVENLDALPLALLFQERFPVRAPDADDELHAVLGAGARGEHELGVVVPAHDADVLVVDVPYLAAHLLHLEERIVAFTAGDLRADAVAVGVVEGALRYGGHRARMGGAHLGPLVRVYLGMGIGGTLAPVVAARPAGAAPDGIPLLHHHHLGTVPRGADGRPAALAQHENPENRDAPADDEHIGLDLPLLVIVDPVGPGRGLPLVVQIVVPLGHFVLFLQDRNALPR